MFGLFDPLYLMLLAPTLVLSVIASIWVKASFSKWSKRALSSQISGAQAARAILDSNDLREVRVERVGGWLSDHYDPAHKTLRLSPAVYDGRSVSAVGVAAHEAGHALQDKARYAPLVWRTSLVPLASIGSNLTWVLILAGMFLHITHLYTAAVVLFSAVVLFQLVTLPVEFDASRRAKQLLPQMGFIERGVESRGVSAVLNAAAMTYVAAAAAAIAQLLYFLVRAGLLGRSDE
jgi:Zn-dependent membrane protease YugP